MTPEMLAQLRHYARQLDEDAPQLRDLVPTEPRLPAPRPRRHLATALAAAAFVIIVIGLIPLVFMTIGPDDEATDPPTTTVAPTTVPSTTAGPTTAPSTTATSATTAAPQPGLPPVQVSNNTAGSAPFVFIGPDGNPHAYYNREWHEYSPNMVARCRDTACREIERAEIPLAAGSWIAVAGDGSPIRLQVEVDGDVAVWPVPPGSLPTDDPDDFNGPVHFAPATVRLIAAGFESTVLEVTTLDQIKSSNPDAVPYPGGGKLFIDPNGRPWILYRGVLVDEDLAQSGIAVALIRCGDPECASSQIRTIFRTDSGIATIYGDSLVFDASGRPLVLFVTADGRVDAPAVDADTMTLRLARCADALCDSVDVTTLETASPWDPILTIDGDGIPMILWEELTPNSWTDATERRIMLTRCNDESCSNPITKPLLDVAPNYRWNLAGSSAAVAPDGAVLVTAIDWTGQEGRIHIVRCADAACEAPQMTAHTVSTNSPADLEHVWSSAAAFGTDGLPVIAYYAGINDGAALQFQVGFLKCADPACAVLAE